MKSIISRSILLMVMLAVLLGVLPILTVGAVDIDVSGTGFAPVPSVNGTIDLLDQRQRTILYQHNRHTFYSDGLYWCFYLYGFNFVTSTSGDLVYRTSQNGSTWNSRVEIVSNDVSHYTSDGVQYLFSIWYDETYDKLHYVRNSDSNDDVILYRVGTPYSNGTIVWNQIEQEVYNSTDWKPYIPYVATNTTGHPFVTFGVDNSVLEDRCYVTASSSDNGTWVNATGFPIRLDSGVPANFGSSLPSIVPMSNGNMYFAYMWGNFSNLTGTANITGRILSKDSIVFGSTEDIKLKSPSLYDIDILYISYFGYSYSMVSVDNDIHVSYYNSTLVPPSTISVDSIHTWRDYSDPNWTRDTSVVCTFEEVTNATGYEVFFTPLLTISSNIGDLSMSMCAYNTTRGSNITAKNYDIGLATWGSLLMVGSVPDDQSSIWSSSLYKFGNGRVGVMHVDANWLSGLNYENNTLRYTVYNTSAGAPNISSISPNSVEQRETVAITIHGNNFNTTSNVSITGSGITIISWSVISNIAIVVNIALDEYATTVARDVSITTSGGVATLVGGLTVTEYQLNTVQRLAQVVPLVFVASILVFLLVMVATGSLVYAMVAGAIASVLSVGILVVILDLIGLI